MSKRYMKVVMTGYIELDLSNYVDSLSGLIGYITTYEGAVEAEKESLERGDTSLIELCEFAGIDTADVELTLAPEGEGPGAAEEE